MNFYFTCKAASLINYSSDKICQDSPVIIMTRLRCGWWRNFGSCPSKENMFSSPNFADQLWGPPSLLFSGYRHFFPGVNWLGHDSDPSPQYNAEIQHDWHCNSTFMYVFTAWTEVLLEMESAWMGEFCAVTTSTLKMEAAGHQHSSLPYGAKTFFIMSLCAFISGDQ